MKTVSWALGLSFLSGVILAWRALGPKVLGLREFLNFNRTTRNLILFQTDVMQLFGDVLALAQTLAHERACSRSTTGIRS